MSAKKVLSLGQCSADGPAIARVIHSRFGARVVAVDVPQEAFEALRREPFDLVLVNRVLDQGGRGIDFIRDLKADDSLQSVPVMLVSNHADAQQQAMAAGAIEGFGKASLSDARTLEKLGAVLGEG